MNLLGKALGNLRVSLNAGLDPLSPHADQLLDILPECLGVGLAKVIRDVCEQLLR